MSETGAHSLPHSKEYEFTVINPKRPKFIFPEMFTSLEIILIFCFVLYIIGYTFTNPDKPIEFTGIFAKILDSKALPAIWFLFLGVFVWGPMFVGHIIFNRYILKSYLSTAKVRFYEDRIYIDFINDNKKYCSSHVIDLNNLKTYAISRYTTVVSRRYARVNMGIRLVTTEETIVLRLYDYRTFPFGEFPSLKGIVAFSERLNSHIEQFTQSSDHKIKFHIPIKWTRFRSFLRIITMFGIFVFLGIFITIYIYFLTRS